MKPDVLPLQAVLIQDIRSFAHFLTPLIEKEGWKWKDDGKHFIIYTPQASYSFRYPIEI